MDQGSVDPGHTLPPPRPSKAREWFVTLLAAALLLIVAVMQRPQPPDPAKVAQANSGTAVEPIGIDPLVGVGKAMLWWKWNSPADADPSLLSRIDDLAHGAPDKFRMAILAGEYAGVDARESRLVALEEKLAPDSILHKDIQVVRMLKAADPTDPEPAMLDGFKDRHGWFARAALQGRDAAADAAFRAQTSAHGARFVIVLAVFGVGLFLALIGGLIALIVLLVRATTGALRPRFVRTPPELGSDRALWLETFAVFFAGFLVVHLVGAGLDKLAAPKAAWPTAAVLLMQWSLVGVIFWPRLRGMSRERFLGELGWHRGRGVAREIGCGALGYLAGLPIYFLVALVVTLVSVLIEWLRKAAAGNGPGSDDVPLPDNKVFDLIGSSNGWMLVLLGTLIVVWAPLVEESIFRGALFRHIRGRLGGPLGLIATVALVAGAFAIAHSYVLAGVIMVATLGGIFALMREWRGSLIAPMTAHCLHNSMVLTLIVSLLPVMRG